MKKLFLSVLLVLPTIIYAQIQYEQGYFIDNNNSKITCLIRNVEWLNNPSSFDYKLSRDGEVKTADISEVKEFGWQEAKYVRARVKIDTSVQQLKKMGFNRYPEWSEKEVFLKIITEGKAILYFYRSPGLERFFYSVDGSAITQLVYKQFLKSSTEVIENLTFLQQLKTNIACGEISDARLKKVRYAKSSLARYFEDYNICNGQNVISEARSQKLFFSITPGIDFQSFSVDNDNGITSKYDKSTAFRLGVMAEYVLAFNKGKWSILAEPTYQSYKSDSEKRAKYTSIEIPLGVRHSFFVGDKSRLFVNLLMVSDIPLKYEAKWSQNITYKSKAPSISLAAGVGFSIKKVSFEGRRYFTRSVLENSNDSFFVYEKFSLIAGYRLGK